ncbi:MAG: alpha/beta hydrolase [Candidatus Thermoplasmatota archaeon]|nr:alpha/beta hydrolase [Candidatus Thermoplasmatota archaeon]
MYTYVLIPGAWLGGWVWRDVEPLLSKRGHRVFPITLTGMGERVHLASPNVGMETAVRDVLNVIEYNELSEIVLVGHSFAGKVAAAVVDKIPEKIKRVVYLDSFFPANTTDPQGSFDVESEFGPLPNGSFTIQFSETILRNIGKDVVGENKKWMLEKCTPWPIKLATDPIKLMRPPNVVGTAYIFCTLSGDPVDEIIKGKWGKLEGPYRTMETAHYPMVTRPDELAKHLLELPES